MNYIVWTCVIILLSLSTFGIVGIVSTLVYITVLLAGFLAVVGHHSLKKSQLELTAGEPVLSTDEDSHRGVPSVFELVENAQQNFKYDKRLTGSSSMDSAIQEVLDLFIRDYLDYWYFTISEHQAFHYEIRQVLQRAIITFASRTKEVQWVSYLTTRLVDDFANHLKIFRIAIDRMSKKKMENRAFGLPSMDDAETRETIDLEKMFFQVEKEVEMGRTRQEICLDDEREKEYLQDISEVLLYLLLPQSDFDNKNIRYFLREIIAVSVLLSTAELFCDPDYINQTISWLCSKEGAFTVENFLTTIKTCDDLDDLEETKKNVDLEISKLRSLDSKTFGPIVSEINIKKRLGSLMFVRKLCVAQIRRVKTGECSDAGLIEQEPEQEPELLSLIGTKQIPRLGIKVILEDNTALSYFIEFMGGRNAEHYVFFYLTVEGFRATAQQQLSILAEDTVKAQEKGQQRPSGSDFEQLRLAAANIYDEYLSPKASPRIILEDQHVRKIVRDIKSLEPSGSYFDSAQMHVFKLLESQKYYGTFLKSTSYIKCLMDLELIKEKSDDDLETYNGHDDDALSIASGDSTMIKERMETGSDVDSVAESYWTPEWDVRYSASITQAGICKEKSKSYGVYSIQVCKTDSEGSVNWIVCRRYSDFHDLHMQIREKFQSLHWLSLPGKRAFGNMDRNFIEKRRQSLEDYLLYLLSTDVLRDNYGLYELVAGFLETGEYYKGKNVISRKMDHIVHPIKSSVRNASNAVKNRSDSLTKLPTDVTDGQKSRTRKLEDNQRKLEENLMVGKLSDALDVEDEDNIPLRILLLLMDEIFELKDRNQWLRRRIVVILKQIIKTTFGDRINRKIVEYVDVATSAEQIVEYVKMFRDSFWPGGVLAEPYPERPYDVRRRMRMVTKAKMLGSIPDELKRFLGAEVTREGVARMLDMFQHVNLNKRLFYVLFESLLATLFPDNKFAEIFKKIHSKTDS
eukprot:gene3259-3740_t